MVDDVRETPPLVWLSSNCCALTPAAPPPRPAPLPERVADVPERPPSRLMGLLKRRPRADKALTRTR
jgi:hypothetical protein